MLITRFLLSVLNNGASIPALPFSVLFFYFRSTGHVQKYEFERGALLVFRSALHIGVSCGNSPHRQGTAPFGHIPRGGKLIIGPSNLMVQITKIFLANSPRIL